METFNDSRKKNVLYLVIKENKYVITYMLKVTQKISLDLTKNSLNFNLSL